MRADERKKVENKGYKRKDIEQAKPSETLEEPAATRVSLKCLAQWE